MRAVRFGSKPKLVATPYQFKIIVLHGRVESLTPIYLKNVTANGECYRPMNDKFFVSQMNDIDLSELSFQQDGATCHRARARYI